MIKKKSIAIAVASCVFLLTFPLNDHSNPAQQKKEPHKERKARTKSATKSTFAIKDGAATILVHGTSNLVPGTELIFGSFIDTWAEKTKKFLHEAAPLEFPLNSMYIFRWSGNLSIEARKKAAQELYKALCNHTGSLTLIAHSHGCNVLLYLAELAQADNNIKLSIDKLILCAPPVQKHTAQYIQSPLFKRVFCFYSTADVTQVADPQGLHKVPGKKNKKDPFFSQRTFPDAPHITQARVLFNLQSPSHIAFVDARFVKKLPMLLTMLNEEKRGHVIINIPSDGTPPHFVERQLLAHSYVPRSKRSCKCHTPRA